MKKCYTVLMEITSQDPNEALKEFNTKIQAIETKRNNASSGSIIFWLLVFPPYGLFKMWKFREYHVWFANLSVLMGLLNLPILLGSNISVSPQILESYSNMGINFQIPDMAPYINFTIIISLIEIGLGLYYRKRAKNDGELGNLSILIILSFWFIQYLPLVFMIQNIITGLYSQISLPGSNEFPIF